MIDLLLALPVLLIAMVVHEYAHGAAALTQGDDTALLRGRLTFNPIKHLDPWMSVILPLLILAGSRGTFVFGGAKPVPVNPAKYRHPVRSDVIVSLAGIAANIVFAGVCVALGILLGIVGAATGTRATLAVAQRVMMWGLWLNLLLASFNLIPIPPLDGSHVLYHALPRSLRAAYRATAQFGILVLLGILWFVPGLLRLLLWPALAMYDGATALMRPYALGPFPF